MAIQVVLEDHTGNVRQDAKLSDSAPVQRLIPAIVTALKLPITGIGGYPITYHLSHDNRRLQQDETLESAGVQSGDPLIIAPETMVSPSVDQLTRIDVAMDQLLKPQSGTTPKLPATPSPLPWETIRQILKRQDLPVQHQHDGLPNEQLIVVPWGVLKALIAQNANALAPNVSDTGAGTAIPTDTGRPTTSKWSSPQPIQSLYVVTHFAPTTFNIHVPDVSVPPRGTDWIPDPADWGTKMNDLGDDIALYYQHGVAGGHERWRRRAKQLGQELYKELAVTPFNESLQFSKGSSAYGTKETTATCICAPREFLAVPYELLHDDVEYLTASMPLYRQVTNFTSKPAYPFAHLIKQLQETGTSLEVLFISADATNKAAKSGLKINEEIKILQDVFSSCLKLRINFTHAIGEECIDRLRDGSTDQIYHIIHFAGHAVHDREVGERSYISIGDGLRIEARQLATWIKDKGIWLFYLNACTGAAIGHKHQLAGSESLGLMDAILSAGVPYTVGFRWPIPPTSSIKLAQCFYKNLLAAPYRPEIAMLRARNFAFGENADDPVWAASMLVAQPSQLTFDNGAV